MLPTGPDQLFGFTPSDWRAASEKQAKTDLMAGRVFRRADESSAWANKGVILFDANEAEDWLRSLNSPHVLPSAIERDPDILPRREYVTLAECVSWLAGQTPSDSKTIRTETVAAHARIAAMVEGRNSTCGEFNGCPDGFDPEIWYATILAEIVRETAISKMLGSLVAQRKLQAFGVAVDQPFQKPGVIEIDPDFFLQAVEFRPTQDELIVAKAEDQASYEEAREAGHWVRVRFRKTDVTTKWGASTAYVANRPCSRTVTRKKAGRKALFDWGLAKREFDRLWEMHGPLSDDDPDWNHQAKVERAISTWFVRQLGDNTRGDSTIRRYVSVWISEARASHN